MASNKKPSIYSDRGNIGSANDLDEYGVWVKSEPHVLSADSAPLGAAESDDLAFSPQEDEAKDDVSMDFDDAAFDIDNIDSPSTAEKDLEDFGETSADDITFDDFADEAANGAGADETITYEDASDDFPPFEAGADDSFDVPTVKSIENGIGSIENDFNDAAFAEGENGELTSSLLKKIATELSTIRTELKELKKEFAGVTKPESSGSFEDDDEKIALTGDEFADILGTAPPDSGESDESKGLADNLSDDDDETIALTGDELDNILNSADFTEESGTDETPESEMSFEEDLDSDLGDFDLAGEENETDLSDNFGLTDETGAEDSALSDDAGFSDEIDLSSDLEMDTDLDSDLNQDLNTELTSPDDFDFLDDMSEDNEPIDIDESKDAEELKQLREEGALPITDAPENADYLETDDAPVEDISIDEDFDLSDAVIDEPELSTDGISDNTEEFNEAGFEDMDSFGDLALSGDSLDEAGLPGEIPLDDELTAEFSPQEETLEPMEDFNGLDVDIDIPAEDDFQDAAADDTADDTGTDDIAIDDLDDFEIAIDEETGADEADELLLQEESLDESELPEEITMDLDEAGIDEADLIDELSQNDEPEIEEIAQEDPGEETGLNSMESFDDFDDIIDLDSLDEPSEQPVSGPSRISAPSSQPQYAQAAPQMGTPQPIQTAPQQAPMAAPAMQAAPQMGTPQPIQTAPQQAPMAAPAMQAAPQQAPQAPAPQAPAPQPIQQAPAMQAAPQAPQYAPQAAPQYAPQAAPQQAPQAPAPQPIQQEAVPAKPGGIPLQIPTDLRSELRNILSYMDQLLESLPEQKIEEFAKSQYFDSYKKLFKELGLV